MKMVQDWLYLHKLFFVRMNTYSGKTQSGAWMRQGRVGMADIVVLPRMDIFTVRGYAFRIKWLEVKAPKGVQSPDQKRFEKEVTAAGMTYHIIRSLEDLEMAFR